MALVNVTRTAAVSVTLTLDSKEITVTDPAVQAGQTTVVTAHRHMAHVTRLQETARVSRDGRIKLVTCQIVIVTV